MIKRSECTCSCHNDGSVHCVPCCYPDTVVEFHEQQENIKKDMANAFAIPEYLLKGKNK